MPLHRILLLACCNLANLLLAVERDLIAAAIARLPRPAGLEASGWWHIIRRMSRQRPYLWKNHRDAIDKGCLEKGTSAAVMRTVIEVGKRE